MSVFSSDGWDLGNQLDNVLSMKAPTQIEMRGCVCMCKCDVKYLKPTRFKRKFGPFLAPDTEMLS